MYILLAAAGAALMGFSVIFQKYAVQNGKVSTVNTACNIIVLLSFLADVLVTGSLSEIFILANWPAIILSAVTLALSWVFYFRSLKKGPVSIVGGIQNLSIPMTMVFSRIFLSEEITRIMILGSILILVGAVLMLEWKGFAGESGPGIGWIFEAVLAAFFVAVSYIFTKMDTSPVSSSVSGMIRYGIVVIFLIGFNAIRKEKNEITGASGKFTGKVIFWLQVILCGVFLGASYVCLYRAIALGSVSVSTTIFRSSIVVAAAMSALVFKESMGRRKIIGILMMLVGLILFTIAG